MMAKFHKTLQYHEDTTRKKNLSNEDREFLLELQKELNTQDTTGTADPRFWVIRGSEKYRDDDEPEEYGLICEGEVVTSTTKETIEYLNKYVMPHNPDKDECSIEEDSYEFVLKYKELEEEKQDHLSIGELNEYLSDIFNTSYEMFGISSKMVIYPSTMFLTEKSARKHLELNHYHYSNDAHTYCMCAWRSPEVEKLWKILRETQW